MTVPSRLKMILLLIAMAQLATEVTRLLLVWTPQHARHDIVEEQVGSGPRDAYGSARGISREDLGTRRAKQPDLSGARGPPSDSRKYSPPPSSRLRRDVRVNDPPWCQGCRQPEWRCERHYDEWYCDWYDEW
jgi:hypothetical protein